MHLIILSEIFPMSPRSNVNSKYRTRYEQIKLIKLLSKNLGVLIDNVIQMSSPMRPTRNPGFNINSQSWNTKILTETLSSQWKRAPSSYQVFQERHSHSLSHKPLSTPQNFTMHLRCSILPPNPSKPEHYLAATTRSGSNYKW